MQSFRGMTLDDDNTISKENSKGKQKMDFRVNMETLGNSDSRYDVSFNIFNSFSKI